MNSYVVHGGRKLGGEVKVNASKNSAVAILIASLVNEGKTTIKNLPRIEEVFRIIEVLESMRVSASWRTEHELEIIPPEKLNLEKINIEWSENACVGVVMASGGYPGSHKTGFPISGLDSADKDIPVFHAGTKLGPDGQVLTSGGRVLTVVAKGKTLAQAREKVYANISRIKFEGCHYRKDIALIKSK